MLLRHFLKINIITSLRVFICGRDNDVMRCVGRENAWNPRGGPNPRGVHAACQVHAPCVGIVQNCGYITTLVLAKVIDKLCMHFSLPHGSHTLIKASNNGTTRYPQFISQT